MKKIVSAYAVLLLFGFVANAQSRVSVEKSQKEIAWFMPVSELLNECEPYVKMAVTDVAGPKLLEDINLYKDGAARNEFKSCCGIETWPLFKVEDYDYTYAEISGLPEREETIRGAARGSNVGPQEETYTWYVMARVPEEKSESAGGYRKPSNKGYVYKVTTKIISYPMRGKERIAKIAAERLSKKQCVSSLELSGIDSGRQ